MKKIEFFRHNIEEEEIERVKSVLNSLFITTGDQNTEFEKNLAEYLDLPFTATVTSCTGAMHLSLLAAGIGPGDEVITTPFTFVGTANSILMAGATPVLADIDRSTANIDPDAIEDAITPRTRAVIPVHLYGQMCDMEAISDIAGRHGLTVIEDAAHCLEGEWKGSKPGHYGDYACFSFYATKNITSGEGGAISVKDSGKHSLIRKLRLHGFSTDASERYTSKFKQYDVDILGWKYNMDNIHAAILIEQLKKTGRLFRRRKKLYRLYSQGLSRIDGVELHHIRDEAEHACHLITILVDPKIRDQALSRLQDRGIGVSINFHPLHLFTYYRERFGYREGMFPASEEIGSRTISLPFYPKLKDEEAEYVIESVRDILERIQD
ncbi:MAG: UDP-4-amino-4,6-dideoxy-N-acetyl-beta-L-altrosamine transaminase [Candidatus Latescibacteria bacterium]|nr:UDP-4-amino-4,6-dideoxy-N-acetyl-beta-L-altrosamine transaminase [bacterium]MBD3423779.1 UDP-4-amino-4,6-dideoxy-N-acetyl-beta-L-altrosamine transaminase [Candidatus Latescibacterota bacterium]